MREPHDNFPLSVKTGALEGAGITDNIALITPEKALDELEQTARRADHYAENSKAANTRRAYRSDVDDYLAYCKRMGLEAVPAEPATVALYLTQLADRAKLATIRRRIVSINLLHSARGLPKPSADPYVREIVQGILRADRPAPTKKAALTVDLLRDSLSTLDGSIRGTRDRAILLLGFSGALRRSEIAALNVADLRFSRKGIAVTLRRSKTDQAGAGFEIGVPTVPVAALCPVRAVKAWLEVARIGDGALFRTVVDGRATEKRIDDQAVTRLVKRVAARAGIDGDFAAHSLRAGFVTSAASSHVAVADIQRVTRHKSLQVLNGYIRRAGLFDDAALQRIIS